MMQYSNNVQIFQKSAEEWLLQIDNEKVFDYLVNKLKTDFGFGRFMKVSSSFSGDSGFEYRIELFDISKDVFTRHIGILTPEFLNSIANG
ncbi:hypothetical protein [Acinetobacter bereziniae]|uniref:hypothetical protein n=2 Tax=Acinetobacter bereziniae TaxID=106648 RepID=UPI001250A569|nr:hypothetical protein [Acinetobacter bereziniae]MCV2445602.1 hypothetical protein [Acinetobacter bereziniae]